MGRWVALGGALGAVLRFLLGGWMALWAVPGFPWPTFTANLVGSGMLGFLAGRLAPPSAAPRLRAFLTVGLCGGFTTFSTFDLEVLRLLQAGSFGIAGMYSLGSVGACVAGVMAGLHLGRRHFPRTAPD